MLPCLHPTTAGIDFSKPPQPWVLEEAGTEQTNIITHLGRKTFRQTQRPCKPPQSWECWLIVLAYTPTVNLEFSIGLTCMFLDFVRKRENPERTHTDAGRTCKLNTERPHTWNCPGTTFLLWGNSANYGTTMPASLDKGWHHLVTDTKHHYVASCWHFSSMLLLLGVFHKLYNCCVLVYNVFSQPPSLSMGLCLCCRCCISVGLLVLL